MHRPLVVVADSHADAVDLCERIAGSNNFFRLEVEYQALCGPVLAAGTEPNRMLAPVVPSALDAWISRLETDPLCADLTLSVYSGSASQESVQENVSYVVKREAFDAFVRHASKLWLSCQRGGVLPGSVIQSYAECGLLLDQYDDKLIKGASYDLRLGEEYFQHGSIKSLSSRIPLLTIQPYDYAIVESDEQVCLPRDITARFDLTVGLFYQGIIMSNGTQIDPGFHGRMFCLLFNTSSSPVLIKRLEPFVTIEFHTLTLSTYSYKGKHSGKELVHYLPANATVGAIHELKREIDELRSSTRLIQTSMWGALALFLALLTVILTIK